MAKRTAASLSRLFDGAVPRTTNPQAHAELEQVRDRTFSFAYRMVRDLPEDDKHVNKMLTHLVQAQIQANMAILNKYEGK